MIKIQIDKNGSLTQWDIDRYVIIDGVDVNGDMHFAVDGDDQGAYVVKPERVNGLLMAKIPNHLLTESGILHIYVYPKYYTAASARMYIAAREKPDNYDELIESLTTVVIIPICGNIICGGAICGGVK